MEILWFLWDRIKTIDSHLTNRTQYVKYKHYEPDIIEISTGVPHRVGKKPAFIRIVQATGFYRL